MKFLPTHARSLGVAMGNPPSRPKSASKWTATRSRWIGLQAVGQGLWKRKGPKNIPKSQRVSLNLMIYMFFK